MTMKEIAKKIIASINPGNADISGVGDGTIKGAIRSMVLSLVDPMLATEEGFPADAKLTRDAIDELNSNIDSLFNISTNNKQTFAVTHMSTFTPPTDGYLCIKVITQLTPQSPQMIGILLNDDNGVRLSCTRNDAKAVVGIYAKKGLVYYFDCFQSEVEGYFLPFN